MIPSCKDVFFLSILCGCCRILLKTWIELILVFAVFRSSIKCYVIYINFLTCFWSFGIGTRTNEDNVFRFCYSLRNYKQVKIRHYIIYIHVNLTDWDKFGELIDERLGGISGKTSRNHNRSRWMMPLKDHVF